MSTVQHNTPSHRLAPEIVAHQQRRAVLFMILADAVFFGSLMFAYFYLRSLNVNDAWLPDGLNTASAPTVWIITAVTVLSALAYRSAEMGIARGQRSSFLGGSLLGLGLVIVAIGLTIHLAMTWPILMSDGSYASTFIVMTFVELVHLVILALLAIGIWNRGIQGKLDDGNYNHATLVGYFWYWVALTAVLGALTTFYVN